MPPAIPSSLAPAVATVLTSFRPSLRLIGLSRMPASRELEAFMRALFTFSGDAPTACEDWTAHDLVAHRAAGSEEMTRLINLRLVKGPEADIGPTRPFGDREAPYRAMADRSLRRSFVIKGLELTDAILRLQDVGPRATVTFTGWDMTAEEMIRHGESELILHRWDLVGSDLVSLQLLDRPELLSHGHKVLDRMGIIPAPAPRADDAAATGPRALLALWGRDPDRQLQLT